MRLPLLAALLLILCACDDGRWAPGFLVTEDGETLSNTDDNYRSMTINTITRQLNAQLGAHWRVEASIAELPRYEGSDGVASSGWSWAKATTSITLLGDGTAEPPLAEDQIDKAVRDYLYHKVERAHRNLTVTTIRVVDPMRFAQKPARKEERVEKPTTPMAPVARIYAVQAGDTWADLSQAFYGSSQHWRHLADANQGGELTPGRTITIPPKP